MKVGEDFTVYDFKKETEKILKPPQSILVSSNHLFFFLKNFSLIKYLKKNSFLLNDLQEKEKLHLANKLRKGHIYFKNQKMKVRLASQLFSNSVADALAFCRELQMVGFDDVEGTVQYLKTVNDLFDVLNSRNMTQMHYKKPVCSRNRDMVFQLLEKVKQYLTSIKLPNGTKAIDTPRKTGFIGFLVCIESLKAFYIHQVEKEQQLKYFPVYKISQDHLEFMFGHIRSHGECNTNPTKRQFQSYI